MSERLQNVLRILEGGASDRNRTQLGIGPRSQPPASNGPIGVHRIVGVGRAERADGERESGSVPSYPDGRSTAPGYSDPQVYSEPVYSEPVYTESVHTERDHEPELPPPEPEVEPSRADERDCGVVVYAAENEERALVTTRVVDSRYTELPRKLDPRLVLLREPESAQAKAFRVLAHRARHSGDPRVVLVTSPRRGEGKTTCAVNLALALAEDGGARVLLLEANARTPSHAQIFGMNKVIGLPRQMARLETALVPWTTYELSGTRLHVLPAENDGVVMGRNVLGAALSDLRGAFDYVIIDAPSVLDNADVMALVDSVDAVVVCARAKKTRAREVEKATKQLAPAPVLGVVLLDVKEAAKS